ncbi:MAG: hypothetical protein RL661_1195, partial [Pseudomonadota bacterium]
MTAKPEQMLSAPLGWRYIKSVVLRHKRELILAQWVAVLAALAAVPVPLLLPMLVDEVLLNHPGVAIGAMNRILPEGWQGPTGYILTLLLLTMLLRLLAAIFNVIQ